ncbi:hypothetical protein [Providencia sp. wls1950]|uniref:hypothetical protein n=1 Tax=Providencia sp. wls1950 TaxID=2675147 RepID=UPI0012B5E69B|nr:hypothetical protein [Providencia sp. wls1950]MTB46519.1 hypothetical protein [Providencia sp. wls1950]
MNKASCTFALTVLLFATVVSGCTKNTKAITNKETIESCSRYLPEGSTYWVSIEGEIDLNKKFHGDLNVNVPKDKLNDPKYSDEGFKLKVNQFMDCVGGFINDSVGDVEIPVNNDKKNVE